MTSYYEPNNETVYEDCRASSAVIHESSVVDAPCQIGEHTTIMPFAHIMAYSMIGENCIIGHNTTIASGVVIGNNVKVMNNALLNNGVILEDEVYLGPCTVFTPMKRIRSNSNAVSKVSPTLVRQGASIGPNSTIASGVVIGRFSFVEAATVVDGNVPDFAVIQGGLENFLGWRCECTNSIDFKVASWTRCAHCGKVYTRQSKRKIVQESIDTDTDSSTSTQRLR